MAKGVADSIREILNGYKHSRFGLGEAMKQIKEILYTTNGDFYWKGKVRNIIDNKIIREQEGLRTWQNLEPGQGLARTISGQLVKLNQRCDCITCLNNWEIVDEVEGT